MKVRVRFKGAGADLRAKASPAKPRRIPARWIVALATALVSGVALGDVRLVQKGKAECVIVAPSGSMSWAGDDRPMDKWGRIKGLSTTEVAVERRRRVLRDSIKDLAASLRKMADAEVPILEGSLGDDRRTPLYVGDVAREVFGPVGASKDGLFGFRVVANAKGVGLYGESEYGTSYAIYEFLHRLGCRWFMPSEMGECIPRMDAVSFPETDESRAPATQGRSMQLRTADRDFIRRNRMDPDQEGPRNIASAHALERYLPPELVADHPEWRLLVNGAPSPKLLRWTRQEVADAIADVILARLDQNMAPSVSLSPGDYVVPQDDPEERSADPEPRVWEPAAMRWSVTDRLILLANRIAERVRKKYPEVRFGVLAYVNYSMPPAKQKVHPNVVPVLAPIDFNRHHPMTWPDHPNDRWLLDMVEGWGRAAPGYAFRGYGMNLAELSAPNPFITKWGTDIPLLLKNHCAHWQPETMGGWESMMPGFYLSTRMTFDPNEKPEAILEDLWKRFYGPAAEPMARYWRRMDRAWIDAKEYSGSGFGYLRIFSPAVMNAARADLDEARKLCDANAVLPLRRIEMIDETLRAFELFMKMRREWAAGSLEELATEMAAWKAMVRDLSARYREQFVLGGLTQTYVDDQFGKAYANGSELAKAMTLAGPPMLRWKYRPDKAPQGATAEWAAPDFDDASWNQTHVVEETWSTLGFHNYMGRMIYRTTTVLNDAPEGKKSFLWIGSTDGSAKLYVNGHHVKYVVEKKTRKHEEGEVLDAFEGFCQPAKFDVTSVIKPGVNQITILCERTWLNELGTGGLLGPVVIFREKS